MGEGNSNYLVTEWRAFVLLLHNSVSTIAHKMAQYILNRYQVYNSLRSLAYTMIEVRRVSRPFVPTVCRYR